MRPSVPRTIKNLALSVVVGVALAFFAPLHPSATGRSFYVAPNGSPAGDGSIGRPLDLATALSTGSPARAGDTIWLRGGVYGGAFTSMLAGTVSAPIIVRNYQGERVTLDGATAPAGITALTVYGSDTWYWGLEVMNSGPTRVYYDRSVAPEYRRGSGLSIHGPRTKFINMIVHDALVGIGFWRQAVDAEIHGSLVYNNGVVDPLRGHGQGLYIQNETGIKRIGDVISFNNFSMGMKAFGEAGPATDISFEGIMSFNNGSPVAFPGNPPGLPLYQRDCNLFVGTAVQPVDRIRVENVYLYHLPDTTVGAGNLAFGYTAQGNLQATVRDNYVAGGHIAFSMTGFRRATVTGNTFYADNQGGTAANEYLAFVTTPGAAAYVWDDNTYSDTTTPWQGVRIPFFFNGVTGPSGRNQLRWSEWRAATSFDLNSTYTETRPTGPRVFVRPNQYEPGRAHIAIFNWALASSVSVDISGAGLASGQRYEIRDAQNFFGAPLASGAFAGSPVLVSMTGRAAVQPIGLTQHTIPHTAPEFAALIVIPGEVLPGTVAAPTVTPLGGVFPTSVSVSLATTTSGATIRYTTDGSIPTSASTVYTAPFIVRSKLIVRARAFRAGMYDSPVSTAGFTTLPAAPTNVRISVQ